MKSTRYKVTWQGRSVTVSATYYMGMLQKAAEKLGVSVKELRGAKIKEMYKHEVINK